MTALKKKQYESSKLKKQLEEKKRQGIKTLEWKLTKQQRNYIEQIGYYTKPIFYYVKTRQFYNVSTLAHILKDIHYKNKRGKSTIVLKLKESDRELLDEYKVIYYPCKYRIHL